jgi:glutathione peroxidase
MIKLISTFFGILSLLTCKDKSIRQDIQPSNNKQAMLNQKNSIHQFQVKDINGKTFDFSSLKGKKILVVNVASKCGLTSQYKDLQTLYTQYKDKNFVIVGFPANNFMKQEPGSDQEIASFCELNYGVTFPIMSKISVKDSDIHPIYQFLTQKSKNGVADSTVDWNFQKYLLDENGFLVEVFSPRTLPLDEKIVSLLK